MTWTTLPRSELTSSLSGWQSNTCSDRPCAVLIHGVGLRAESWGAMLAELAQQFDLIVPDLPGHGESRLPAEAQEAGLAAYSDPMAELLEQVNGPSLVIGHSLGALIALDLAIKHPDRVSAVVPLNAIYRRSANAAAAVQARAAELAGNPHSDPSPTLERWFGSNPDGDMAEMAEHCRNWLTSVDPRGYHMAYHVFAHEDGPADAALAQLSRPALFITGADEPNSTPDMSLAMAALAPSGQSAVIDNARHMMPMTHAREVADLILTFHQKMGAGHD